MQLSIQIKYKIFVFNYFQNTEMYLEPSETSEIKPFAKIVNGLMLLTVFRKSSILGTPLGSKNATKSFNKSLWEQNFFSFSCYLVKCFFLSLYQFLFLPIFKSDLQVSLEMTFISIQTNIYVKTFTSMNISCCRQDKTVVSDNFKRNLHHFNMKKVEHAQLFGIKMKEDQIIIFCKIHGHINIIILKW